MSPGKPHTPPPGPATRDPARAAPAPRISLRIDSLHLPGYSVRDAGRLAGALERELGRLLGQQPAFRQGYRLDVLRLQRFRAVAGERPERTGRRLAALLAAGLQL